MKIKSVIFKDTLKWDDEIWENVAYPATEQLEDFLEANDKKIVSINYFVTDEGYNNTGLARYCNHILLVYED